MLVGSPLAAITLYHEGVLYRML